MIQFYFISIIYLVITSFLHLFPFYRTELMFMISLKQALSENKKLRMISFATGLIITFFLVFFPISPGPRFLGDFIPSITVFFSSFYFLTFDNGRVKEAVKIGDKDKFIGYAVFIIALIHFIYPSGVLV